MGGVVKIGVVPNLVREAAVRFTRQLVAEARNRGWEVWVDDGEGSDLSEKPIDMVIATGGDGTMLRAVSLAHRADRPVLGFNLGTLGFLAEADPGHLTRTLDHLEQGDYRLVPRMTVMAELNGLTDLGVNDVVVEKIDSQRLIELEVEVDSEPMLSYRADGLVISTPTGSTAYSFSAGGPLLDTRVDALVMTPVAPHSLFSRSLVLSPESEIRCRVARDRPVQVSVDGRTTASLGMGDEVLVRRGPRPVMFVAFERVAFSTVVTERFGL